MVLPEFKYYCPARVYKPTSTGTVWRYCMADLPCEEHLIEDKNQGHREWGIVLSDVPERPR